MDFLSKRKNLKLVKPTCPADHQNLLRKFITYGLAKQLL